jgi:hypothetical protein
MSAHRKRSKQERDEARRQWLLHQKEHEKESAWRWARIAAFEKLGPVSDAQFEEFLEKWGLRLTPAQLFMAKRWKDQPPPRESGPFKCKKINDYDKKALIDLVASYIPLDPHHRRLLAGELRRLWFPNAERDRRLEREVQNFLIEIVKDALLKQGMTAAEADREIIKIKLLGINSIHALHKRMHRAAGK